MNEAKRENISVYGEWRAALLTLLHEIEQELQKESKQRKENEERLEIEAKGGV